MNPDMTPDEEDPARLLPPDIMRRAFPGGPEYAWPIADIPAVIRAAHDCNLVSIGGQLQFRILNIATCECAYVEVDTYRSVSKSESWQDRVTKTHDVALEQFARLKDEYDFVKEGRRYEVLSAFEAAGGQLEDVMCFVWYVESKLRAERDGR